MKAVVVGASGQLGAELVRTAPRHLSLVALSESELDITLRDRVLDTMQRIGPDVILNAAAYTAVDAAESHRDLAFAVNAAGAESLALAAEHVGARLLHVSTDFVFKGTSGHPYRVDEAPEPLGVYGESKLAGERGVLGASPRSVVVRTSWLYSATGGNFVKTMLRLMRERDHLRVVSDQVGTPTWARGLAEALWHFVATPEVQGIHHWSDAGAASWYDFAVAIAEEGLNAGLLERAVQVEPIRTEDYPTPARRPSYSVLDKTQTWNALGFKPPHWRVQLRSMLAELAAEVA